MAQPLTVNVPHQLGQAEARRRIEEGMGQFMQQIGGMASDVRQSWAGDRLNFSARVMGQHITGAIDVLDDMARIELILPGLLGMMAGKIRGRLQQEGQVLLEKK